MGSGARGGEKERSQRRTERAAAGEKTSALERHGEQRSHRDDGVGREAE